MGKGGSQTIGYKYFLGEHMIQCHGPADKLLQIKVDKKIAWEGESTGGQITINKPKLFGGDDREGGITGKVDVEMGYPTQLQNDYLVDQLGDQVPAFRGVVGLVLRQCYLGNNPYLKPWSSRWQRIYIRQNGIEQWYPEKAGVPTDLSLGESIAGRTVDLRWRQSTKNPGDVDHARMGIGFLDSGGAQIGSVSWSSLASPYPWTLRTYSAVAPAGAYGVQLWLNMSKNGSLVTNDNLIDAIEADLAGQPMEIENAGAEDGTTYGIVAQLSNFNMTNLPGWANTHGYGERYAGGYDGSASCFAGGFSGSVTMKSRAAVINIPVFDINPVHVIRECLTDPDWGMGYGENDIDDASFMAAADTIYDEKLGVSFLWDKQTQLDEFIQQVIRHIDAALYVSRTTGKFVLKLIRYDYDPDTLIHLNETNIAKVSNPKWPAFGELVNTVTVNFWDANTGNDASLDVQDPALVQQNGQAIGTTVQYPGFTNRRNATIAGARDLRSLSSRILSCTIYCDETAKDLNIGDTFKYSWAKWRVSNMVMRVLDIAFGDGKNNQIKITCTEDIFETSEVIVVGDNGTGWVDPSQPPIPTPNQIAFEVPYYEAVQQLGQTEVDSKLLATPEIGYVAGAAARAGTAINARIWTDPGSGYVNSGPLDFCPYGETVIQIVQTDTEIELTNILDLDDVTIGTFCQIGDGTNTEICRVDAVDLITNIVTLGRGCLDTTPKIHVAGSKVFFWDEFSGYDPVERVDGEIIGVKITPTSGQGTLDEVDAVEMPVTLDQRGFRPYAPGNLLIEGESYGAGPYEDELSISWTDRDRTQQTGGTIYDHTFGDIGPEVGTEYRVQGYINGALSHTEEPAVSPTTWIPSSSGFVTIEVHSKRDGVYSWQPASHSFFYTAAEVFRVTEADEIRETESGDFRVTED